MTLPPYRYSRLTEDQSRRIRLAFTAGVAARLLAAEYGVTVRTIYRVVGREAQPRFPVTIADWCTEFALTDEGPVQVAPWRPR